MSSRREKIVESIRTIAVIATASVGSILLSLLTVQLIRINIAKGEDLASLAASLFGCLLLGGIFIALCCLAIFHALSFWRSTYLKKAIRLVEALQMLGAQTHKERLEAIRHHALHIYKTKTELSPEITEDVCCKKISTFLSPMFFNIDRLNAIGSPYYCCDFEQLQQIIARYKEQWGSAKQCGDTTESMNSLDRALADMRDKYNARTLEYTAVNGRNSQLEKQLAEVDSHMAVLIELANKVTNDFKSPRTITADEIKARYLAIGKIYGITKAPSKYVKLFRTVMPKSIINQGGAPSQGSAEEET